MVVMTARSLRRTLKATDGVNIGNNRNNKTSGMLELAAAVGTKASGRSSGVGNCLVSGGKGILIGAVRAMSGGVGANWRDCHKPLSPKTSTKVRPRGSGNSIVNVGDAVASVENSSPRPSIALANRGDRSVWIP